MTIATCPALLLFALIISMAASDVQTPASSALPSPVEIEEALTALRSSRNPTFVEYKDARGGRALVVGVPYSYQRLNDDLTQDFENIYQVLDRKNWIQHFVEIQLMIPQPLIRVRATVNDVRRRHANEITKAEFQLTWLTDKLGP